jgi:hypothetical protein
VLDLSQYFAANLGTQIIYEQGGPSQEGGRSFSKVRPIRNTGA